MKSEAKNVSIGLFAVFVALLKRDLLLGLRARTEVLTGIFFMVIVASLFPLAIGADLKLLRVIAPGVLWIGALLSTLLTLPRLFEADHKDGSLEQLALTPSGLHFLVYAKLLAHWILSGLPLVLLSPLVALQFDLPTELIWTLMLTLLIGTPSLSAIGGIGAALTLGVRGGGVLLSLLLLPLFIPVLVFGAGAIEAQAAQLGVGAHLSILGALLLVSWTLGPWACSGALKVALE
jgi:heme exporter protein B